MNGPHRCLVAPFSATSCLPPNIRSRYSAELPRTHSELVKFALYDPEYDKLGDVLCQMHLRCIKASSTAKGRYKMDEKDLECVKALQTTDPWFDKKRIEETKGGLLKDSYLWILDNADFQRWRDEEASRLLWIRGDPSKGKTMLLSGIIDELHHAAGNNDPSALLSFFFCQATDARINHATAVLRGLIYLLVKQRPALVSHLRDKYEHAGQRLFEDGIA